MNEVLKERCITLAIALGVSVADFESRANIDLNDWSDALKNLQRISLAFPRVDIRWLITGDGSFFVKSKVNYKATIHTDKEVINSEVLNFYQGSNLKWPGERVAIIMVFVAVVAIVGFILLLLFTNLGQLRQLLK